MTAKLVEITSINELENILARSDKRRQLIFKHSNTCPISTKAYTEMQKYLEATPSESVDYSLIVVQVARNISNEVALRLNVVHESPQAILVDKGKATWHKSHFDITKTSLTNAVS
ncbi:MAG: bacillithiol system redox-active protein YtxJ [Acidobacteria bacterium]|nr:bacillithiol system redox-active protein YtxJ [Acidobacteriota bacterium]